MFYYTEGNILSVLAFFVWIPIALYGAWRWPPARATAFLFLGGLLLLPEIVFFKIPGLPEFAKLEIILLGILLGALIFHRQRFRSAPKSRAFRVCVGLLVLGSIVTVFLNPDPFTVGSRQVPGQVPYDAVHAVITVFLSAILPFYVGAVMFRSSGDLRVLLKAMVVAGLLYSLLQVCEILLSPQLHRWVYGFYQHSFFQTMRGGGFRPMVFMAHGLALALFTSLTVMAAAALRQNKVQVLRYPALWAMLYLWLILLLSKSAASFVYSLIGVPLVLFTTPRTQALVAAGLVTFLLAYPALRVSNVIPVDEIREIAEEQYGADRAGSLMFRFEQDQKMLDRTMERPWFGWGAYCRGCLYKPWSGDLESIRDGAWIIQFGDYGIIGFLGKFGLLLFPLIALVRRLRFVPRASDRRLLAGLALMLGFAAFDLIPNGDFSRLPFILSGALFGCLSGILQQAVIMRNRRRLERIAAANKQRALNTSLAGVLGLSVSLLAAPAAATPDAVGGGFADAGLAGAYYDNGDFEGTPAFTRRDVRIDFDWDELRPIGGSTADAYRRFPRDGFSIRWSGRIIPRFSEDYTFEGEADDGIRIRVRAPGQSEWKTVVDRWDEAGPFESAPFAMHANDLYDIEVEYREVAGRARCKLRWKSKSTPSEVIDPVRQQGLNLSDGLWASFLWADMTKSARYAEGAEKIDALGWPNTKEIELIVSELNVQQLELSGTYLLSFEGKARVRQGCCGNAVFQADGRRFERNLPKGIGYDASTNTTTAVLILDGSRAFLQIDQAERGGSGAEGVTHFKLMRPVAAGSQHYHRPDEVVYRPFKRVVEDHFTALRFLLSPDNPGSDWSQRTLPGHAFFMGGTAQENWEYLIMLANETGRDLYISIPIRANDEYLEKLALLMRNGSDGQEPYRNPVANPLYPPLNPNLRVYIEWDNEIWNWAFGGTQVAQSLVKAEHDQDSATWKVIDYDGHAGDPEHLPAIRRWHAMRTVEASKAFRRVWGDDAMGTRIRILTEYQYDNYQDSALLSFDFIDDYYNNRVDAHVSDPHPVSYYLWGAGGAAYYGLRNGSGKQTHTVLRDAGFEDAPIEAKSLRLRPSGSAWTFAGQAGVIRPEGRKKIEALGHLSTPTAGKQAGFLVGKGSISQKLRFAKPGTYAIAFQAAGSGDEWPGYQPFDILVDGRVVSPRNQKDYDVSDGGAIIGGWSRAIDSLSEEWGSAVFRIDEPGLHTISFVGREASPNYLLIDEVRIASADAIVTSGFHKGEALGEAGEPDLVHRLESQAKYARAFGLQVVAYEAGWSVGGDFHQVPIQNWTKLEDPRATVVNDEAIGIWDRSGSFLPVWGVYKYWPDQDFPGAGQYSIMQSFRRATQRLPDEASSGRPLPATLRLDDADWSQVRSSSQAWWSRFIDCGGAGDQWHAWMLIAPEAETYSIRVNGEGSGRLIVEVDGDVVTEISSLDATQSASPTVKLTKGAHAVRIVMVGSEIEVDDIVLSVAGAAAALPK